MLVGGELKNWLTYLLTLVPILLLLTFGRFHKKTWKSFPILVKQEEKIMQEKKVQGIIKNKETNVE